MLMLNWTKNIRWWPTFKWLRHEDIWVFNVFCLGIQLAIYSRAMGDELLKACGLWKTKPVSDRDIDLINLMFDSSLQHGHFDTVDAMLEVCDIPATPTTLLLAMLVATLPAKAELNYRAKFAEHVTLQVLIRHPAEHQQLLQGLV